MGPQREPRRHPPTRLKLSSAASARLRAFQLREKPNGETNVERVQGSEAWFCNQGGNNRRSVFGYFARGESPATESSGTNRGGDSCSPGTAGCSVRSGAKGIFARVRSTPGAPSISGSLIGDHVTNADQARFSRRPCDRRSDCRQPVSSAPKRKDPWRCVALTVGRGEPKPSLRSFCRHRCSQFDSKDP